MRDLGRGHHHVGCQRPEESHATCYKRHGHESLYRLEPNLTAIVLVEHPTNTLPMTPPPSVVTSPRRSNDAETTSESQYRELLGLHMKTLAALTEKQRSLSDVEMELATAKVELLTARDGWRKEKEALDTELRELKEENARLIGSGISTEK